MNFEQRESPIENWQSLKVEPTNLVDPYAQLSQEQLEQLSILGRIKWLIKNGKVDPQGADALQETIIENHFKLSGLDANWLLSQRETISQNRRQQKKYNQAIEGKIAKLVGWIIPLDLTQSGQISNFLLLPYLVNCSHILPPPADQVVHILATEPINLNFLNNAEQFRIEGILRFVHNIHIVYRLDGMIQLESSYKIEPKAIISSSDMLYPRLSDLISY
jgi:hypothetical protein